MDVFEKIFETPALMAMLRQPLAAGSLAAATFATGLATYGIARAPARIATRLGPRGLKRQRAIAEGGWFPAFEPLVRWAGTRLSGIVPESLCRVLDRRLTRAGEYLGLSAEEYVVLVIAGAVAGFAAGLWHTHAFHYGATSVIVGASIGAFFAQSRVDAQIERRAREITHGLPYVTDLLSLGMTAGLDFPGAVKSVLERSSDKNDALTEELERILQELALGHTRRHALEQLADRTQVPAAIEFVYAVAQADERGSPLADVLAIQATVARQKRSAIAEENADRAQQLMMIPLLLLVASTMILLMVPTILQIVDTFDKAL